MNKLIHTYISRLKRPSPVLQDLWYSTLVIILPAWSLEFPSSKWMKQTCAWPPSLECNTRRVFLFSYNVENLCTNGPNWTTYTFIIFRNMRVHIQNFPKTSFIKSSDSFVSNWGSNLFLYQICKMSSLINLEMGPAPADK